MRNYSIVYSREAIVDLINKTDYIAITYANTERALKWNRNLRKAIEAQLSQLPQKHQIYDRSPWKEKGVRMFIRNNDLVMYVIDEANRQVKVINIFTKGKNI